MDRLVEQQWYCESPDPTDRAGGSLRPRGRYRWRHEAVPDSRQLWSALPDVPTAHPVLWCPSFGEELEVYWQNQTWVPATFMTDDMHCPDGEGVVAYRGMGCA